MSNRLASAFFKYRCAEEFFINILPAFLTYLIIRLLFNVIGVYNITVPIYIIFVIVSIPVVYFIMDTFMSLFSTVSNVYLMDSLKEKIDKDELYKFNDKIYKAHVEKYSSRSIENTKNRIIRLIDIVIREIYIIVLIEILF